MARPKGAIIGEDGKLVRNAAGEFILKGTPEADAYYAEHGGSPDEGEPQRVEGGEVAPGLYGDATEGEEYFIPADDALGDVGLDIGLEGGISTDLSDQPQQVTVDIGACLKDGLARFMSDAAALERRPAQHATLEALSVRLYELRIALSQVNTREFALIDAAILDWLKEAL